MKKLKGVVYALVSSGTFGMIPFFSIPLMTKAGMNETSILSYRYFFSTLAIAILCIVSKNSFKISFSTGIKLFALSIMYACAALGLIISYSYIPSGVATTIHFLYPVIVVFLMAIFYKEKISVKLIIVALLALAGVGFLSFSSGGDISYKGLLIALSTAFSYAIYISNLNMKGVKELDGKVISFYVLLFGTLIFGVLSLCTSGISSIPNPRAWTNILLLALIPTVVSMITLVQAVRYAGSTTTSILGAFEPLTATIIGVIIFFEPFTIYSFIGLSLIIMAVSYIVVYSKKREIKS